MKLSNRIILSAAVIFTLSFFVSGCERKKSNPPPSAPIEVSGSNMNEDVSESSASALGGSPLDMLRDKIPTEAEIEKSTAMFVERYRALSEAEKVYLLKALSDKTAFETVKLHTKKMIEKMSDFEKSEKLAKLQKIVPVIETTLSMLKNKLSDIEKNELAPWFDVIASSMRYTEEYLSGKN